MRRTRILGAVTAAAALLTATAATGTAGAAATNGIGTSKASTTVLNVALGNNGSLLDVRVLGDDGSANIDPGVGTPSAASSALSPLTSSSAAVSALNIALPKISVSSTGSAVSKTLPTVSLATPVSTGSLSPLSLSAVVDAAQGATSGLTSTLSNVSVVGGLLSVPGATSSLGASAKPGDADGLRGISVPSIQLLNLGAVLQGLGVDPANLTLGQVGNALTALNTTVPNGAGSLTGAQLVALVGSIQTTLANTPVATPPGISGVPGVTLISALPAPLQTLLAGLFPGGAIPSGVTDVGGLVTALGGQITSVVTGAVNGIKNAPLLEVDNVVAGLSTKAADTVANSKSTVEASLGAVKVGNVSLPGLDLAATAAQVTAAVNTVQSTVNGVLNTVGLGNLITVKVLDQAKSVAADK
ncbi:MAG: hypothetical protein JWP02_2678, partial [Acidimicrobiales bacterium]|nr:hypothetical protein [Acidimicrobiales bacterium]